MPTMSDEQKPEFPSSLEKPAERFLSKVLQHSMAEKWRTPDDFLRHFPPSALMKALAKADSLRSSILVEAVNVHVKLAKKKSIESATEDLELALQEGVTTPDDLMKLLPADEQVRYLGAADLWKFAFEEPFWKLKNGNGAERERCIARMSFLLECGLQQKLLTLQKIADGMTFELISRHLPAELLRQVVVHALTEARKSRPLNETSLLEVVPLAKLTALVPLQNTWDGVVIERLAAECGFVERGAKGAEVSAVPSETPKSAPSAVEPAAGEAKQATKPAPQDEDDTADWGDDGDDEPAPARLSGAPPKPTTGSSKSAAPPPPPPPPSDGAGGTAEDAARQKAIAKLTDVERLPPSYQTLSTPVLLSIESMYADLLNVDDDEDREACIIDSFPNEAHLKTAMLALIELLDPSIDVHRPPISDADAESLVKVVAFEERQRQERSDGRRGSSVKPPPPPPGHGRR